MAYTPFKMKGPSLYKSPAKNEEEVKTTVPPTANPKTANPKTAKKPAVHSMFGQLNDKGTKIVNEQGNWVSLTKGSEGASVRSRATKSGNISGGPEK